MSDSQRTEGNQALIYILWTKLGEAINDPTLEWPELVKMAQYG